jgi:hypothetical protein
MTPTAHGTHFTQRGIMFARLFGGLRRALGRYPHVSTVIRAVRALVHFGPWRGAFRAAIRVLRPPRPTPSRVASLFPNLDVATATIALKRDGLFVAGVLPPATLTRLRMIADQLPVNAYTHMHEANDDVRALVTDPGVLRLLRAHFGSEPVLLECSAVVHESGHERPSGPTSQRRFHFDYAGWQSLNMFVYLTDVDVTSAPHEVALGSHRSRTWRDALRVSLDDDEAYRRFGSSIRTVTGVAGSVFFEDTEAFHRRAAGGGRRVLLNVLYSSHRGLLSHGRRGLRYAEFLHRPMHHVPESLPPANGLHGRVAEASSDAHANDRGGRHRQYRTRP